MPETKQEDTEEPTEPEEGAPDEDLIPKEDLPQDEPKEGEEPETPKGTVEKRTVEEPKAPIEPASKVPSKPTPVQGESEREQALRLEVQRLKSERRKDSVKEVVDATTKTEVAPVDPYKELRDKGYSDDDIKQMEVAVDTIARQKGYVRAEDSYRNTVQGIVDSFIEEHTEYDPKNDVDDIRWTHFQSVLKSGIYNLSGKTPKQLHSIFNRIDEDVKKEMGEPITVVNKQQLAAGQHKINVASHSGGTKTAPKSEKIDLSQPIGGIKFKGFDSEDFE